MTTIRETRDLRFVACGDINVQHRADPAAVFADVQDVLGAADLRVANMEMCLSGSNHVIEAKGGWTQSDPRMVESLLAASIDAVTTANNVTFGAPSVLSSLDVLDANGIAHTGSGRDLDSAHAPAVIEKNGVRIGMLGYTSMFFPLGHAATPTEPGVAVIRCHTAYEPNRRANEVPGAPPTVRSWPAEDDLEVLRQDVEKLRRQVDVLIAYFHMGVSGQTELAEYQRILPRRAIDYGADLVLGASSHVPQAIEVYKEKVIFCGLGNFAFDWPFVIDCREGLIAECEVSNGRIAEVAFRPVYRTSVDEGNVPEVQDITSGRGRDIVDRVSAYSAALGTSFIEQQNGRVVVFRAETHTPAP